MSINRLSQDQAPTAVRAFHYMDEARRSTRLYAHSTGQEVVDRFTGMATTEGSPNGNLGLTRASVHFDPENPVKTQHDFATLEDHYAPDNTGSAKVQLDYSGTSSLATVLAPNTQVQYQLTPQGEHLSMRRLLQGMTVDVNPQGTWTIQETYAGFKTGTPLVLSQFDDPWKRFEMFLDTSYSPPQPLCGEG